MALGGVAGGEAKRVNWNHACAMQCQQAMRRAHKTHTGPARERAVPLELVAHHFGDRQFCNRLIQRFLQALGQCYAANRIFKKERFGFAVHRPLEAGYCTRVCAQGL